MRGAIFSAFMLAGVNAVLPPIGADLDASARELGLVGTLYALGLAVFQLAAGRMGDVWGRRRIFLWGMGIFTVMGAVLGFVTDIGLMIGLRFFFKMLVVVHAGPRPFPSPAPAGI